MRAANQLILIYWQCVDTAKKSKWIIILRNQTVVHDWNEAPFIPVESQMIFIPHRNDLEYNQLKDELHEETLNASAIDV